MCVFCECVGPPRVWGFQGVLAVGWLNSHLSTARLEFHQAQHANVYTVTQLRIDSNIIIHGNKNGHLNNNVLLQPALAWLLLYQGVVKYLTTPCSKYLSPYTVQTHYHAQALQIHDCMSMTTESDTRTGIFPFFSFLIF